MDLRLAPDPNGFSLYYLLQMYKLSNNKSTFFNPFFVKLAGNKDLSKLIAKGLGEDAIKSTWEQDINSFKNKRKKYLIYPD